VKWDCARESDGGNETIEFKKAEVLELGDQQAPMEDSCCGTIPQRASDDDSRVDGRTPRSRAFVN